MNLDKIRKRTRKVILETIAACRRDQIVFSLVEADGTGRIDCVPFAGNPEQVLEEPMRAAGVSFPPPAPFVYFFQVEADNRCELQLVDPTTSPLPEFELLHAWQGPARSS